MALIEIVLEPLSSDPDVKVGEFLTLERADGRSVWRQRLLCRSLRNGRYRFAPVDASGFPEA